MKKILFLVFFVQASMANVCQYINAVNKAEPGLMIKALTASSAEVEGSAEFKEYYSNYYLFVKRGLEAKAVNLYDDYINEASNCSNGILARLEGFNAQKAAGEMATKLETSPVLRDHFTKVFGVQGYNKFINDLKTVQSTSHLVHAFVMLPVSGIAAMVALGALVSSANVVAGVAAVVMIAGVGYGGYRVYRHYKLDLKTSLLLSAAEKKAISDEAVMTATAVTRDFVRNVKLKQMNGFKP